MATEHLTPPRAQARRVEHRLHGDIRTDDYYWLRQRKDQSVLDYLAAENEYTAAIMADTAELQEKLYEEMRSRIQETDRTAPIHDGGYLYYERTEEGKQYPIYCRKKGDNENDSMNAEAGAEEILLDLNAIAAEHEYLVLGNFEVSPDHKLLAYALDMDGSEAFTLRVKDLENDVILNDEIPGTYYGLAWANDNRTLYYTTQDEAKRPYRLHRHVLGNDPADDELLYQEDDELYNLGLRQSKSGRYLFVTIYGHVTSEVRFLDADDSAASLQVIQPRIEGSEYSVAHHAVAHDGDADANGRFFIRTNWEARNFRVMEAPVAAPGRDNWREVIPHREEVMLDGIECFRDFLVVYERENALPHIRVQNLTNGDAHRIVFNEPVYTIKREKNPNYDSHFLRYSYASLMQPATVYDYNMQERYQLLLKEQEVPGGYKASNYTTKRLWATAEDGTQVPISVVHRADLELNGANPTFLYGYGSYGVSLDPGFNSNLLVFLERGFVYVVAHIRGGGEMGRAWYEEGKFLHKKNTFTDFIACAEHLIAEGYTSPDHLAVMGRSAGGLLMGAVVNLRPDLFKCVVAGVPFVDVVSTMLDPTIPLTVPEWEEWGNPNSVEFYHYMKSYSPYDNVEAKAYPSILATAGLNDPRVQYWEPAKWVAKLRVTKTDANPLLLKTNMGAGHFSASGRYDYLRELAFEYAFILKCLGKA